MKNKVLVCITIQENSRRLISEGSTLAKSLDAELHILHIKRGSNIFDGDNSTNLLQSLFSYGGQLGGEVHFLCSDNVVNTITSFIHNNGISEVILGETSRKPLSSVKLDIYNNIANMPDNLGVTVVPRNSAPHKL